MQFPINAYNKVIETGSTPGYPATFKVLYLIINRLTQSATLDTWNILRQNVKRFWYERGERVENVVRKLKKTGKAVGLSESAIETYLRKSLRDVGALCLKWTSPGNPGVPDRVVIFRRQIHLVELKAPGAGLNKNQKTMFPRINDQGVMIHVIDSREGVDDFIDRLTLGRL